MGNFSTDSFPTNRWTSSDVGGDLPTAIASIDAAIRTTFGFSVNSLTQPFDIDDDGSIVVQVSIAIGTSNAMIDISDEITASPGANETLKLATVDAIRNFLDVQRLPGANIDLNTGNFDNNLSSADDTAQKAFDTLDDIDLNDLFHFDVSDEFSGVDLESIKVTDRIVFEDAGDTWAKKYTTVADFASVVSSATHTHSQYLNKDGTVALTGNWAVGSYRISTTGDLQASRIIADIHTPLAGSGGTMILRAAQVEIEGTLVVENELNVDTINDYSGGGISVTDELFMSGAGITLPNSEALKGTETDTTVRDILYISGDDYMMMGVISLDMKLHGQQARPEYDAGGTGYVDLALMSDLTAGIADTDFIQFDVGGAGARAVGKLQWNATDGTLEFGMLGSDVTQQVGQEIPILCRNESGGDIDNGEVVYVTGSSGTKPLIALSKADAKATAIIFGVATEDIANASDGYVTTVGLVRGMDTSVAAAGAPVFLSDATAGALSATPAFAPSYKGRVGYVITQDGANGVLFVDSGVVNTLRSLSDVETQAPAAGDCPVWSSDNQWFDMTNIGGFFNGTFIESFDAVVTESGGTVTMSLEQAGGGDLTMKFSGGEFDLDCTDPVQTIALTVGASDDAPQENFIYILESTKALTKSTSDWPATEHIRVGYFLVQTAAGVASDGGPYINQNWNDHRENTNLMGHMAHIGESIRLTMRGASWHSGVAANASGSEYLEVTGTAPSVVEFKSTAGVAYQLHKHTVPAIDMSGADNCHVVNWYSDAYHTVTDLADIVDDAADVSLSNRYFNLVFWGVANKTGEHAPLMVNLPTGSYSTETGANNDTSGFTVTTIPREFTQESCTGFLICKITVHQNPSGTWTLGDTTDLRGSIPATAAGGGVGGGALTAFPDNQFTLYDADDVTRIVDWELGGITTGNTRTLTAPDEDGEIALVANVLPLAAGSGDPLTGDLYIQNDSSPTLFIKNLTGDLYQMKYDQLGMTSSSLAAGLGHFYMTGVGFAWDGAYSTEFTVTAVDADDMTITTDATNGLTFGSIVRHSENLYIGGDVLVDNEQYYNAKNSGGTGVSLLGINSSNIVKIGNAAYRPLISASDVVRIQADNSDPGAAVQGNGEVSFFLDESGHNLMVRATYSDGTDKTGTVCALA